MLNIRTFFYISEYTVLCEVTQTQNCSSLDEFCRYICLLLWLDSFLILDLYVCIQLPCQWVPSVRQKQLMSIYCYFILYATEDWLYVEMGTCKWIGELQPLLVHKSKVTGLKLLLQMKGEKELIEKILETEINIYRSIRDGSALMQHMEDFYYISLLEVR